MITQSDLKKYLTYVPDTGDFIRNITTSNGAVKGDIAGYLNQGYIKICVCSKSFLAHRLAFLYMTGEMPKKEVDHINGVGSDNRWVNLREASHSQNVQNLVKNKKNNTTGYMGVSFHSKSKKYRATIILNRKQKSLGLYKTPQEAHHVYLEEKRKIHDFCTI